MKLQVSISLTLLVVTVMVACLFAVARHSSRSSSTSSSLGKGLRKLEQKQLIVRVRLSDKPSPIKLSECQGDCDRDSDCAGSLVCFQRKTGEDAPGCAGEHRVNKRADFCVLPEEPDADGEGPEELDTEEGGDESIAVFNPQNIHHPNPPRNKWVVNRKEWKPHDLPIRMTFGPAAKLQLYWQPRAWWQEENFDRRWCLRCRKGCLPGHGLMIVHCDQGPGPKKQVPNLWNFQKVANSNSFLVKVGGEDACLSRWDRRTLQIDRCDSNNRSQQWVATNGIFARGSNFQISPFLQPDWCITNRHHPRYGEAVSIEPCATARKSYTAHWNMY